MRWLLRTISAFCLIGALICGGIWNARRDLPYNEDGRYLDLANAVVVHEQSVLIYGGFALLFIVLAGMALYAASRL